MRADAQKDFSSYIAAWLFGTIRGEHALSLVYTFGSHCLDTMVLCHSVLEYVKQDLVQRSEMFRKSVQLEQNWCYVFPFGSMCDQTYSTVIHSL